ncbi:hypothetical protein SAY87_026632 [Trapa incisa]|uniref:Uncharacterized protein n=1 Tax=Trapa incisa TaxID=236973 RepID=A0AAN7JMD3_9MYRT|nr:hypothetical protein SAY87_026632 [Trapa incisa]
MVFWESTILIAPSQLDGSSSRMMTGESRDQLQTIIAIQEAEDTSSSKKENAGSCFYQSFNGKSMYLFFSTANTCYVTIDLSIKYNSGQDAAEETSMAMGDPFSSMDDDHLSSLLINFPSAMPTPDWYLGGSDEVHYGPNKDKVMMQQKILGGGLTLKILGGGLTFAAMAMLPNRP